MSRLLIRLLPLLLLGLAILAFLGLRATRPEAPRATPREQVYRVSATTVTPDRIRPGITLHARVEAPRKATLEAAVNAEVASLAAREGDWVAEGAELLGLDPRDLDLLLAQREADVAEMEAQLRMERQRADSDRQSLTRERALLDLAGAEVQRAEDLLARQAGSQTLLDQAREKLERQALALHAREREVADHPARLAQYQARLARAGALRDQALLDRQRARVTAPFAGRISRVLVAPGDRVRAGDALVELYATDDLELRAQLPFRYLPAIRAGLTGEAALEATALLDGEPVSARLDRLGGEAGSGGGVDALFRLAATPPGLIPGRLLELRLALPPESDVVSLPVAALYGLDRIYRLDQARLEGLRVERVGEQYLPDTTRILVRSPQLRTGDRILTTQLPNAVTGLKVTVLEDTPPPEGHDLAVGN